MPEASETTLQAGANFIWLGLSISSRSVVMAQLILVRLSTFSFPLHHKTEASILHVIPFP